LTGGRDGSRFVLITTTATEGKTVTVIEMSVASDYQQTTYGILFESTFVHEIPEDRNNRSYPHRFKVWSNVNRPNKWPEGEWTDFGFRGGPGAYVDPNNKGTDEAMSVTISTEAMCISAHGDSTGTKASGQVWGDVVHAGDVVTLRTPDGDNIGPYTVTFHRFNGLSLTPVDQ
jgi:hypothetical protein